MAALPYLAGTHLRYPAKAYNDRGEHVGPGPWLDVIHAANRLRPDTFGEPTSTGPWWAGGVIEEYPLVRVLHREDGSVSLIPLTADAEDLLVQADREVDA